MTKKFIFTTIFLLFTAQFISAHEAWIEHREGDFTLLYGHAGKDQEAYDLESVRTVAAFDAKGKKLEVELVKGKEGVLLTPKGDAAIMAAILDAGYWVKTTEGWKNTTKRKAEKKYDLVLSQKSHKYAKTIIKPGEACSKPIGLRLEILPSRDPLSLRPGDKLSLTVLLEGKPLEGARVRNKPTAHSSDKKSVIETDKQGKADVKIMQPGIQTVTASFKTPRKGDPDADLFSLVSSLTFEVR